MENTKDLDRMLEKLFVNEFRTGYVTKEGVCLPKYYETFEEGIKNFQVRDDDVWVCSFPKTGTTWTQEMVWCIANNLDFEKGKIVLSERFPFFDHSFLFDYREVIPKKPELKLPELVLNSLNYIDKLPSPRFIKTHLPFHLLPKQIQNGEKKPKIIYVTRNPKDTCVSYYHHCKLIEGYRGSFDDFCKLFLGGKVCYAPFWGHISSYLEKMEESNVLYITYEDMKTDLKSVVLKTAQFLGKTLTGEQVETLLKHLSFESMKSNSSVNYENVIEINKKFKLIEGDGQFMRSGKVDQWKGSMSEEYIKLFEDWSINNLKNIKLALANL